MWAYAYVNFKSLGQTIYILDFIYLLVYYYNLDNVFIEMVFVNL